MNHRLGIFILALGCFTLSVSRIVASTGNDPQNHPEHLEVVDGTGTGDYMEGVSVTLNLTVPEGKTEGDFLYWELVSGDGDLQGAEEPKATYVMGTEPAKVKAVFASSSSTSLSVFLSSDETTGPKYRKIGLNGFPIPDEKPQAADEVDSEPEETFIDAFQHSLTHQTTDVYIPIQGSELSLAVRRNWQPEVYNNGSGLPLTDRPDRPFGPGWRSNLCATIEFVHPLRGERPTASVTDENGTVYRFIPFGSIPKANETAVVRYMPLAENRHQQEVLATRLEDLGNGTYRFTRKMGTTLYYQLTQEMRKTWRRTRINRLPEMESIHQWARLEKIMDRFGNVMTYSYDKSPHQLFPTSITLRKKSLTISYKQTEGVPVIKTVTDPLKNEKSYSYQTEGGEGGLRTLSEVQLAPSVRTAYLYSLATELDPTPRDPLDRTQFVSTYYYFDLRAIRDPNGKQTSFGYAFDHSRQAFTQFVGQSGLPVAQWFSPAGNPRNVSRVSTPETSASFQNNSLVRLDPDHVVNGQPQPSGSRVMRVTDAAGGVWTWTFSEGEAINMLDFVSIPDPGNFKAQLMILYKKMEISTPENGLAVATFDKGAGMALKTFKDVGATVATTFGYTDRFDFLERQPWLRELDPALLALYPTQYWGDPNTQTNAEGQIKRFEYDPKWRVMKRIVDEKNQVTEYGIDPITGNRVSENIAGQKFTQFQYYSTPGLRGILAAKSIAGGTGSNNLTTVYSIDDTTGNVVKETTGSSETVFTYDENNNKTSTKDPNGNVTLFTYDSLNRLTVIDPPGAGNKTITYDARGNKVAEKDENDHSTLREFDGLGRVTAEARDMNGNGVIDPTDLVTRTAYNGLNSKTSLTTPNGDSTTLQYDGLNRLIKTIDPLGNETNLEYGENSGGIQFGRDFQPTKVIDARGYVTLTTYDFSFRPKEKKVQYDLDSQGNPIYAVTKLEYDAVGNVVKETDPLNGTTVHGYDSMNRRTSTTWPDGTTIQTFFTPASLVYKTIDELGNDTSTEFDSTGRPVKVSGPLVDAGNGVMARPVTQTVYDAAGNVLQTINPLNRVWSFTYDNRNRKVSEVRPGAGNPTLLWSYDNAGNVIKTTSARGYETETTYDAANRPVEVKQPAVVVAGGGSVRPTTTKEYDSNGNVTVLKDPNGYQTWNTYDALNRLLTTQDALGITVTNDYDPAGNRISVTDGKNQTTRFDYDGLNRNTKITDALNRSTVFSYNAVNKTARVDARGQRTDYGYDSRNRLIGVYYSGRAQDNRLLSYDAAGNLLSVSESDATKCVAYTYDALKRQLSETSAGLTHTYKYDLAGNRLSCLYGGLSVPLISGYDEQNRLTALAQGTNVTTYTYDADGNVLTKTLPNGDAVATTYDALGRRVDMLGTNPANAANPTLYRYLYEYDTAGNVKKQTEYCRELAAGTQPGVTTIRTFGYDPIYRLTSESDSTKGTTVVYGYDDANNRTTKAVGTAKTTYTYNAGNQLTKFNVGNRTVTYTYDANGNRATRKEGTATDTFGWDYENRLVSLSKKSAGGIGNYLWGYDHRTRRVSLDTPETRPTKVSFSGGTSVREIENGVATVDYVRGSDWGGGVGGILYTVRGGVPSFTHYNSRGDVVAKTNASGNVTYQSSYEGFGRRSAEWGSTADRQKSNTKDEDIPGYSNEGFRFRDFETGAFISKDPAGFVDGPNLYAYVRQNPWTKFDPEGLWVKKEVHERVNTDGTKTKVTDISVTGKVEFTGRSAKITKEQQDKIIKGICKGIKEKYETASTKGAEVNVTVELSAASSSNPISKEDTVFRIVDRVVPGDKKEQTQVGGKAGPGSMVVNMDFDHITKSPEIAAHELGHTMGIRHPHPEDRYNTKKDKQRGNLDPDNNLRDIEPSNIMRYFGSQTTVNPKQINSIKSADLNRYTNRFWDTATND